jgi:hypothetical protein
MKTSPRPKAKPLSMKRPKANPMNDRMSPMSIEKRSERAMAKGGKVTKMAGGGSCRGMGAASKGGKYTKAG